jgi:glyoxylase I family protein
MRYPGWQHALLPVRRSRIVADYCDTNLLMPLKRRSVLHLLTFASGWTLVTGRTSSAEALKDQTANDSHSDPAQSPPVAKPASDSTLPAERVLGIGGLFFRAHDPKSLAEWYRIHLGVTPTPTSEGQPSWHTQAGTTVFAPFPETTKYFGEQNQVWMVNFRVRDLEKMAAQLRSAGIEVKVDPEHYPNGRFARIHDPEGNPIELWEPAGQDASRN